MNANDIEAIGERFTRLEREVRLWKRAATATIVLLVASVAFSPTPRMREARAANSSARDFVVRSLTVVDDQGTPRAGLGSGKDGLGLVLSDEKGTGRASLAALKDGPSLALLDEQGTPRAGLGSGKNEPALVLYDEKGTRRAEFGSALLEETRTGATETTGPSSVRLFDKDGKTIWRAP